VASRAPIQKWTHELADSPAPGSGVESVRLNFDEIYETWYDEVSRWVRALGGPEAEREDLVQDVFVVVHRRLVDFDGENVPGWLYQIARRRVRDFRRLLWVKNLLHKRSEIPEGLMYVGPGPADALETKQKRRLLEQLLDKLNEPERAALVLFEVEGYSGAQIANLQGVPLNTVWARIHKGRKKLQAHLVRLEKRDAGSPAQ